MVDRAGEVPPERWRIATAVFVGLVVGALVRNLPSVIAALIFPGSGPRECGDRSIAECAVAAVPQAIGDIVLFGVVVLSVTVLCAALGVALLALGVRGTRPVSRLGLVALGTSMLFPALWLAAAALGVA